MLITEMNSEQCRETLARTGFGRLGCARDNQPYIVPVYFACEEDRLYGFSLSGQKIDWMRGNPLVCIEVDEIKSQFEWTTVVGTGRYEELEDTPRLQPEREHAEKLLQARYLWWQTAYEIFHRRQAGDVGPAVFYRIQIERLSGICAAPEPIESIAPL